MKITILHGQSHEGSTYHIATMLAEELQGEVTEFFLPRDFSSFCVGCNTCFMKGETLCPHYKDLKPITKAIDEADILILASPVYVYHTSAGMKNLLDHYGYRWMVHRPEKAMFQKQAVCISTAAGGGMKSTNKDMADSTFFWGIGKTYRYGVGVAAINWLGVKEKKKEKIEKQINKLAKKLIRKQGNIKPGIKTRFFFFIMSLLHKKSWNEADGTYWNNMGWINGKKPWKD